MIAELEWPLTPEGVTAEEAGEWTGTMRGVYADLTAAGGEQPLPVLLQTDKERGEARSRRLTEARPALPEEITWLLIITATLGILALAAFTLANVGRNMQIFAVGTLTLVLILMQLAIAVLDRPFSGVIKVAPTDIERVSGDLGEGFGEDNPGEALPCDAAGRPL